MKNNSFFQRNLLTKMLTLILAISAVVFVACKKDVLNAVSNGNSIKTTEENSSARQWFEEQQAASSSQYLKTLKPSWESVITVGGIVHVPIRFDSGKHHIPSLYKGLAHLGREKLIIYEKDGKYIGKVIDFLPSKDFTGKIDFINILNFRQQEFDGIIITKTLTGENATAVEVTQGKVMKKLFNPAVVKINNAKEVWHCITANVWVCHQTAGCECIECQMVEQRTCWYVNDGNDNEVECPGPDPSCPTDGCPGPFSWCDNQGGGGGTSLPVKQQWIYNNGLGSVEYLLINNNALYDAVHCFIENSGDASLFSPVAIGYILNTSDVSVLVKHFTYLCQNSAYMAAMQQAQWPTLGSSDWGQIVDNTLHLDARVRFVGFTNQELAFNFRVIPENAGQNDPLFIPTNNSGNATSDNGGVDGFFNRGWTNDHHWFKISMGGEAALTKTGTNANGTVNFTIGIYEDPWWRLVAQAGGRVYCVCWQDINHPHTQPNPF